jgi:hypothetical protein
MCKAFYRYNQTTNPTNKCSTIDEFWMLSNLWSDFLQYTIAPGILSPPELTDGFRGLIQPFPIRQQRNQFNGAEKT